MSPFRPEKLLAPASRCVRDYLQNSTAVKEDERHLCDGLDPTVGDRIPRISP
ncbi:hypothetical protein [Nostoc sp. LEGE 12450]|uniref:hypothetical protein n=1 Tax=Nostoc sp. LEGE 12450 TaxID=1828643 RepID=UPI00187EE951|nr:hypothetical protein [Nostoc sp. LEGE 12450]MBE8991651.1 hypothetical protein [Nostoc sp. LEGE 12450]